MKNSNRVLILLASVSLAIFSTSSFAAKLLVFDTPYLMILQDGEKTSGVWDGRDSQFTCTFFVQSTGAARVAGEYQVQPVGTFFFPSSDYRYAHRDTKMDIPGSLYWNGDQWVLQTRDEQPGCGNSVGSFGLAPGDSNGGSVRRYIAKEELSAVGIRVVAKRAALYDKLGDSYRKRRSYLVAGDAVAVLRDDRRYAYVRYTNPGPSDSDAGHVTVGWVLKEDLVDPFPQP
ncbi:hypothetical protein WL21_06465 [Burkholderia ubonensis]|uniref:hypothetical protein n=1 Tax=Burkholderia ubonensis TaxID=101571 RepID=UPI00075998FC|nr:hypothetical protein [Burkholderia ubonensis]KVO86865.1 hypothetical protein WJ81_19765 [Burkholderia ubonensis]KVZ72187.1 hypothetical protein WL21_06465 [Burkholderia ubonensis]